MDETLDETRSRMTGEQDGTCPALVVLWSEDAPSRAGEVALLEHPCILGRGEGEAGQPRARFVRQRPGRTEERPALEERRLSRTQLRLRPTERGVHVRNVGRCPLTVGDREVDSAMVRVGDVLRLRTLALGVVERPLELPAPDALQAAAFGWGRADAAGQVGESPALWLLREQLAFLAGRPGHVLIHGESGVGKELAARALHAGSPRAAGPWVARAMATLPESLVEAELFGHVADYPNPGLEEGAGLVGAADGGTLFLDEIGEVPEAVHARLLRMMDDGEYHRLGEASPRRADLRVLAATHRELDALKPDLLARFRLRLEVPPLSERREDIPLLLAHLVRQAADRDALIRERFVDDAGQPRLGADLVASLCAHPYTHHVRELDALLWEAIAASHGDRIVLSDDVADTLAREAEPVDPATLTRSQISRALDDADGVLEATWRALHLKNRFQLIRLLKKHKLGRYAEDG